MNGNTDAGSLMVPVRLLLVPVCALIAGLILYENRMFYHDDAFISLRYAFNFIHGDGLVWNPGEYVQGYTNFLFLLLTSLLGYLGMDLQLATRFISVVSILLLLAILAYFPTCIRNQRNEHPLQYVSVLLVVTAAPVLVWMLGGLETVFFAFLCTAGASSTVCSMQAGARARTALLAGVFFSLAALTRMDAMLLLVISLFFIAITGGGHRLRNIILFAAPCAVILAAYLFWAQSYYGDFLPNTFYAKAGDFSVVKLKAGIKYLAYYVLTAPFLLAVATLTAIAFLVRYKRPGFTALYLASLAVSYSLYVVSVGGDHMLSYRLLVPVIPFAAMLVFVFLQDLIRPGENAKIIVVYLLLALLSVAQLFHEWPLNPRREDGASRRGTMVGKYIAENWPGGSLVALNTAGSTPYFATGNTYIDMLGLNDRHIARREAVKTDLWWQQKPGHTKGDGAYVLSRKPDYIIIGPAQGTVVEKPWFLSDLEMKNDPRFAANYRYREVLLTKAGEITTRDGMLFRYYERTGNTR